MRVLQIGVVGAALAYLSLGFSRATTGYPQAAAFLLAVFVATITVGIAAAVGLDAWPESAGTASRGLPEHGCHGCGRPMLESHTVWVCARCDRAPVR